MRHHCRADSAHLSKSLDGKPLLHSCPLEMPVEETTLNAYLEFIHHHAASALVSFDQTLNPLSERLAQSEHSGRLTTTSPILFARQWVSFSSYLARSWA